jgi:hypothetical protein
VFLEALGHNRILNLVRKLTPHLRSADEHPLLGVDIRKAGRRMVAALDRLDTFLLATPLRTYAWTVVLTFSQPKKRFGQKRLTS